MNSIYVALDLELTGLDPLRDEITEIGMVRFRGDEVLETFSSLVGTTRPIPLKIQQISGITPEEVRDAPSLRSLSGTILSFVKSYPIVGHSIDMDLRFLTRQGLLLNNLLVDTFELASILVPEVQRYSLANLAQHLGITLDDHHRALADAMAAKDLFLALLERANHWDPSTLDEIAELAEHSDWPLRRLFRDLASERRLDATQPLWRPTQREPSSTPAEGRREERLAPLEPTETITPVDTAALAASISPEGVFAAALPGYEHRPQQVAMLEAVAEAFNTPSHLLVEAGTGTGKSLAYLLPAIHFAVQNDRRVVISSNTINLQEQLFTKDVPDIQRVLDVPLRATLLKGRSNYVCLRRLAILRRSRQPSTDEMRVLAKVLAWLPTSETGDRAELILVGPDHEVWGDIQASSETCMGDQCMYRQRGTCFFYRARARAERAHIVIINHALLLSDLALESRVLPEFKYLIIDEAHHLEEQATEQFGIHVGQRDLYAFFVGLTHETRTMPGGILAEVPALFQRDGVTTTAREALTRLLESLRAQVDTAERRLFELFNALALFLEQNVETRGSDAYDRDIPLTPSLRSQPDWSNIEIAWESLAAPMRAILGDLERTVNQLERLDLGEDATRDELVQEIKTQLQRGSELALGLEAILIEPQSGGIYWISIARRDQEITLHSAPLHVGPALQERLFDTKDCVVLTSATLRTGDSFRFIRERLGLEDADELAVDSPFDFKTAVLLYVPKDIPEPNQPYYQKTVENAIIDVCRAIGGRTLVLFTSNSQLNTTYRAVQRPLEREDIVVFAQGIDGSRRQILDNFRSTPQAVLMGTRSFWEGVDVVGQALSCLIIARLPFAVPTDPVLSARAETFDDPFNQYYLPDAILRFRQGFGRLIRSRDDYGVVLVLDKRILTKSYGKTILRSLPPCTARMGPVATLPTVAQRWLDPANRS